MTYRAPHRADDEVTERFLSYRELLFSVVYNMLGSVADTEDVLQEVWLAWAARHRDPAAPPIDNARAYLVRAAANQALARRIEVSRRRETYVGPWLPEPIVAEADDAASALVRKESLSTAVLVVLESLSPLERAVFVLHDVFGFPHTEIGDILGRTPAAVRQTAARARRHLHRPQPRRPADPEVRTRVTERFAEAVLGGDIPALLEVLAPEVTLWTDSGGRGPARSLRPVHGRDAVAAIFTAVAADLPSGGVDIRYRWVAGDPCALVFSGDSPLAAVVIEPDADGSRIAAIYSITNPDKLTGVR
ncbi:sigma-70 family RNA polymerase sigma factor [Nocardia macrotermitis]|uniref:ECF RNA polymerase sigma factor SigJ n=1 Tax=Nocardia macrotermitis TaxID=2585198 RepID=A0A7K0D7U1_9NOCA|nr:sigma-70 family RNA polymerase sigma factor [Nocardia macrotermitis]MQY21778.1 ECF RNA polymerase sigma factor SigJ [Nocardia macrotermitis]